MELIFLSKKKNNKMRMTKLKSIKYPLTIQVLMKIWVKEAKVLKFPKRRKIKTKNFSISKKNPKIWIKLSSSLKIKMISPVKILQAKQFLLKIPFPMPQLRGLPWRKKEKTKELKIWVLKQMMRSSFLKLVKCLRISTRMTMSNISR